MKEQQNDIDFTLIGKYLDGSASPADKKRINKWLNASPENRKEFDRIKSLWNSIEFPEKEKTITLNTDVAWEKLRARISGSDSGGKTIRMIPESNVIQRSITYYLLRIAAVIVVVVGLYTVYNNFLKRPDLVRIIAGDEITESVLPDESYVTLNENTTLTYPEKFTRDKRIVELEGEAFFEVKRNVNKPFVVRVPEAVIEVLGTSFNVRALESEPEVTVTVQDGMVMLTDRDDIAYVKLEKNERGVLNKETGHIEKYISSDENELFWKTRTLIFRDTRLSKVFETLEKLYNVEIIMLNATFSECLLSGKFEDQEIGEILANIAINFNLEVNKKDNVFEISGNGC
jgi:transmembrane sensor